MVDRQLVEHRAQLTAFRWWNHVTRELSEQTDSSKQQQSQSVQYEAVMILLVIILAWSQVCIMVSDTRISL